MERYNKYLVLKWADIYNSFDKAEVEILRSLLNKANEYRESINKGVIECVVIESDWPEYEPTWKLLSDRVDSEKKL